MSYINRLNHAFENAPVLPVNTHTKYVFFSDCHRGIGDNNDNFLKNINSYYAALQYYYQYNFCYIEVGDGDELWENHTLNQIMEIHHDIFLLLSHFHKANHLFMLYGNHDIIKKKHEPLFRDFKFYEAVILRSELPSFNLYVTHGHQADIWNSKLWRLTRFLVRYLWTPLEYFGILDPTSAAKNNTKKNSVENKLADYAKTSNIQLLTGHTHKPTLGSSSSPYYNCGSCVHPRAITCIELCGFTMNLVKWYESAEKSVHFRDIYNQCPPAYPVYVKREVIDWTDLFSR